MSEVWESSRAIPPLAGGEVHVWRAPLFVDDARLEQLRAYLSDEENERVERLLIHRVRHAAIVSRGMLRRLLAGYLRVEPASLRFAYGGQGKPYLRRQHCEFNVSHSGDDLLVAVCPDREVGVDVERIRLDIEHRQIAMRYFSLWEQEDLAKLPDEERGHGFYRAWTRKEAFLKARGTGFTTRLADFDVAHARGESPHAGVGETCRRIASASAR